ncbi:hypothetical protein EDB85DRAFT_2158737 [Lactarius pseudohatsudake]|nr:hypothetical protein EDB85DRAFT_2158737 [Lactarius pseudohatsudake]
MAHETRHAPRRIRHAASHLQEVLPTPPSSSPRLRLTARKPGVAAYTFRHGSPPPPPPCHSAQDPSRCRAATPSQCHATTLEQPEPEPMFSILLSALLPLAPFPTLSKTL